MARFAVILAAALAAPLAATLAAPAPAGAAVLEVPTNGGNASGVGFIAGWKCPPNGSITVTIDGGDPLPMATGVRRGDTASVCGNDGRNGYIAQLNFNLLGDGSHTVVARQNGVPFAQSTFEVVTFGQTFLRGADGTYVLNDFPQPGSSATIEWSEGAQNFVVVGRGGGGGGTPGTGVGALIGTWDFTFTIISTFTERYFLERVETVLGVPTLVGEDELGGLIIVSRVQDVDPGNPLPYEFIALAQSILLCDGYLFNRTGQDTVSGLHTSAFLVGDECGTFFGEDPMTGVRISTSTSAERTPHAGGDPAGDTVPARVAEAAGGAPVGGAVADALAALGSRVGSR